jgi:hypothetical protein
LGTTASAKLFKALMVDIGLMRHLCGMPVDVECKRYEFAQYLQWRHDGTVCWTGDGSTSEREYLLHPKLTTSLSL